MGNSNGQTRRDFLKGAGTLAASATVLAGIAGMAGCASGQEESPGKARASNWDKEVDVVVLGGGIGGTVAAYQAAQGGLKVLLVEAGKELGGSLLISNGAMHTGGIITVDDLKTMATTSDPVMAKDFIEKWIPFRDEWFEGVGAPNVNHMDTEANNLLMIGPDYAAKKECFDFFYDEITGLGAEVLFDTKGVDLVADESNSVIGAVLCGFDGATTRVGAKGVILATGGFGANPAMKQAFIGDYADRSVPRTVPFNTGAGHKMALKLGAQLTSGMGCFYGHLVPFPNLVPNDPEEYAAASKDDLEHLLMRNQYIDINSIVVNIEGRRFANEGARHIMQSDCYASVLMLRQPMGYGYTITDSSDETQNPNIQQLIDLGATVDVANSIEDLVDMLAERGVNKRNLAKTIDDFIKLPADELEIENTAKANGTATPLSTPPFYAIQVTGAPSAMFGGIKIDTDARVLGCDDLPIKGLYATACCAGGFAYDEYIGSLSLSAVYGKAAADTALAELAQE